MLVNLALGLIAAAVAEAQVLPGLQGLRSPSAEVPIMSAADKCTSIVVGPRATTDGSSMNTHSADCAECDWRPNKVPARDWPEGSMRPIHKISGTYPRQVREDRGFTWTKDNLEDLPQKDEWATMEDYTLMGHIPQVAHTYEVIEGMYGIMNEHQVGIGESTCASRLYAPPVGESLQGKPGKALLEASELTQIALERSSTAREAILTMGKLAEQYGFYSAAWDDSNGLDMVKGEGGEALTVIDPTEAWMFHIIPDDSWTGAVWVAQRVPDDHISVVANSFVIRQVDPDSPDFLYSSNLWSVAKRMGWWNEGMGKLDFLTTYAPPRHRPEYSTRRAWRVFMLAAPSSNLPGDTNEWGDDYPFSIKVEKLLGASDIMAMHRDHFEGTPYSMTTGLGAGPYGDPTRFDAGWTAWGDGMVMKDVLSGGFERAISLFRTSYCFVCQARADKPDYLARLWWSTYAPDSSTFVPFYVKMARIPSMYTQGSMHRYQDKSAWWAFSVVGNWANRFYAQAYPVVVRPLQRPLEAAMHEAANALEEQITKQHGDDEKKPLSAAARQSVVDQLTVFAEQQATTVFQKWKEAFVTVVTTFRDGYHVTGTDKAFVTVNRMFYPKSWLEAVGFWDRPGFAGGIMFAGSPTAVDAGEVAADEHAEEHAEEEQWQHGPPHHPLGGLLLAAFLFSTGFYIARRTGPKAHDHAYEPIRGMEL